MQITNLCNSDKIKGACREHGYTQQYVADRLGLKLSTYRKKESGTVRFSDKQKVALAELLGWNKYELNEYLYGGILPIGNRNEDHGKDFLSIP